jgi:hypothetical protein
MFIFLSVRELKRLKPEAVRPFAYIYRQICHNKYATLKFSTFYFKHILCKDL